MDYQDNPIGLVLIPLALLLGGGAVATAVIIKKKKKALPAPAPVPGGEYGYPYGEQPSNVPTTSAPYGNNPVKQVQQMTEQYKKYAPDLKKAASQAYDIFKSGETPPQAPTQKPLNKMSSSEMSLYFEQRDKTTGKKPTDEEMKEYFRKLEEEDAKKAEASGEKKPGDLDAAKKAAGPLTFVTTAGKVAWAGVSGAAKGVAAAVSFAAPVLVPLAVIAAIGVTVNSYRMAMKKYDKYDDLYDANRANAINYAEGTKQLQEATATMKIAKNDLLRQIENVKTLINAVT